MPENNPVQESIKTVNNNKTIIETKSQKKDAHLTKSTTNNTLTPKTKPKFDKLKSASFGYTRIYYEEKLDKIIPSALKLLISSYLDFTKCESIILNGSTGTGGIMRATVRSLKNILETDMKDSGEITYDEKNNYLKIHCYGDAFVKGHVALNRSADNDYNKYPGILDLIVNGNLCINNGTLSTNFLWTWWSLKAKS